MNAHKLKEANVLMRRNTAQNGQVFQFYKDSLNVSGGNARIKAQAIQVRAECVILPGPVCHGQENKFLQGRDGLPPGPQRSV
jgi:hypothetical protein